MNRRFNKAYLLIPVLYVAVLFALILVQFSGSSFFNRAFGALMVRGTFTPAPGTDSDVVSELTVDYRGLMFVFSPDTPLQAVYADGRTENRELVGYRSVEEGIIVNFAGGIGIGFDGSLEEPLSLSLDIQVAEESASVDMLSFPVIFEEETELVAGDRLQVRYDGRDYALSLPPKGEVDLAGGRVLLSAAPTRYRLVYEEVEAEAEAPGGPDDWFADPATDISASAYAAAVGNYLESAYRGWSTLRYNPNDGTWDSLVGAPEFNETTLTAYLAEAWRRGREEYIGAFNEMRAAADRHSDEIGYVSAPFLGELLPKVVALEEIEQRNAAVVRESLAAGDTTIFSRIGLPRDAIRWGELPLYENIISRMAELDPASLPMPILVGLLGTVYLTEPVTEAQAGVHESFRGVPRRLLFPAIQRAGDDYFLAEGGGAVDLRRSILAGLVMQRAGEIEGDAVLVRAGRNLVDSALSLANDAGLLPGTGRISDEGGTLESVDGSLAPEELYPYLVANPAYPRAIIPYPDAAPGFWIWTIAEVPALSFRPGEYELTVRHPQNRTYYIIMRGIPTAANDVEMELFGIRPWRNDVQFESYSRGRYFDARTQSLLIKYDTRNTSQERIVVNF